MSHNFHFIWPGNDKLSFFSLSAFPGRCYFLSISSSLQRWKWTTHKEKKQWRRLYLVSGKTSLCSCKHWRDWLSQSMSNGNPRAARCGICFHWGRAGFSGELQARDNFDWTNQSSLGNSRFGSRNSSIGAQPWSRIKRLLNSWTFLGFSCSSRLLRALNNMYVEGISLGYMEMEILSGLRTFACEGRSNCGVMFGSGGDECAAFASLESRDFKIWYG